MNKLFKSFLFVAVMTVAFTAQPYGKSKDDIRNKSSGVEVVKADAINVLAVAPVPVDVQSVELPVSLPVSPDVAIISYERSLEAESAIAVKAPDRRWRCNYASNLTDFEPLPLKWKDVHRRSTVG